MPVNKAIKEVQVVGHWTTGASASVWGRQVVRLECGHKAVFDGDLPVYAHVTECCVCEEDEEIRNAT